MECVACGSTNVVEGTVVEVNNCAITFKPHDTPLLRRVLGFGNRHIRAYGCMHCHHLQFTVDFNESDRERYQQFEGLQPSVLERINAESGEC